MLVLTRGLGEKIQIGDNIQLTIVRISPTAVRIGVDAPDGTVVMRRELLDSSSSTSPPSYPKLMLGIDQSDNFESE